MRRRHRAHSGGRGYVHDNGVLDVDQVVVVMARVVSSGYSSSRLAIPFCRRASARCVATIRMVAALPRQKCSRRLTCCLT